MPRGFYFGRYHSIGVVEYLFEQSKQTESDTIVFGLQTQSLSAQIFRLESDRNFYTLDYEIVSEIRLSSFASSSSMFSGAGARSILFETSICR